jgi:hypothetical protein
MAPRLWGSALPVEIPTSISRRQFFQVLANREMITRQEALDAVTLGTLPAAFVVMIEAIPDEDVRWNTQMSFTAQTFERAFWAVNFFGAMQNMSPADIDQLWRDGAKLD